MSGLSHDRRFRTWSEFEWQETRDAMPSVKPPTFREIKSWRIRALRRAQWRADREWRRHRMAQQELLDVCGHVLAAVRLDLKQEPLSLQHESIVVELQEFDAHCTPWERLHSPIIGAGLQNAGVVYDYKDKEAETRDRRRDVRLVKNLTDRNVPQLQPVVNAHGYVTGYYAEDFNSDFLCVTEDRKLMLYIPVSGKPPAGPGIDTPLGRLGPVGHYDLWLTEGYGATTAPPPRQVIVDGQRADVYEFSDRTPYRGRGTYASVSVVPQKESYREFRNRMEAAGGVETSRQFADDRATALFDADGQVVVISFFNNRVRETSEVIADVAVFVLNTFVTVVLFEFLTMIGVELVFSAVGRLVETAIAVGRRLRELEILSLEFVRTRKLLTYAEESMPLWRRLARFGEAFPEQGIPVEHLRIAQSVADEQGVAVLLRPSKAASTPLIRMKCPAKGKYLSQLGVKVDEGTGIATARSVQQTKGVLESGEFGVVARQGDDWVLITSRHSDAIPLDKKGLGAIWREADGQVVELASGKPVVSDYDLYAVVDYANPGSNLTDIGGKTPNPNHTTVQTERFTQGMNSKLKAEGDVERVMHGAQGEWVNMSGGGLTNEGAVLIRPREQRAFLRSKDAVESFLQEVGYATKRGRYTPQGVVVDSGSGVVAGNPAANPDWIQDARVIRGGKK